MIVPVEKDSSEPKAVGWLLWVLGVAQALKKIFADQPEGER
ncbi:hypothetical protein ACFQ05_29020 [Amycolatopsis umgeniensis]|uniref:Uncharacterized protein n=1 Tax=Amycolatopsis umgeniensis TaxID=336628 RepID=A0A841BDA0_9PSEU|nr:hypothetical protein [Amycolatopsis umgeniensis]MBB5856940.1 hypothetical protein [Amycolatopsis umgeniensis]